MRGKLLIIIICNIIFVTGCNQNPEQVIVNKNDKVDVLRADTDELVNDKDKNKKDKLNLRIKKASDNEISAKLKEVEITKAEKNVDEKLSDLDYIPRNKPNYNESIE